jgi:hypothetical protein
MFLPRSKVSNTVHPVVVSNGFEISEGILSICHGERNVGVRKQLAAPQLKRLVAGFPPRRPGFKPGFDHVGFCDGQKWRWGRFSPSTSVSLPIFIPPIYPQSPSPIIRGWYNRPVVAAVPKVPPHKLKKKN